MGVENGPVVAGRGLIRNVWESPKSVVSVVLGPQRGVDVRSPGPETDGGLEWDLREGDEGRGRCPSDDSWSVAGEERGVWGPLSGRSPTEVTREIMAGRGGMRRGSRQVQEDS